jgi:hypothetical protein
MDIQPGRCRAGRQALQKRGLVNRIPCTGAFLTLPLRIFRPEPPDDCRSGVATVWSVESPNKKKNRGLAMGNSSIAAVVAAVLAVVAIAWLSALESPADTAQSQWHMEENSVEGMQAAHTLRGQAWATELFGRRYGRNLLA